MVVAVAKAVEEGGRGLICASTGNTSASAAAYGARYDLPTNVVVPKGNVAKGKLVQAIAYGARILTIDGNFDDALRLVRSIAQQRRIVLVNSVNPHRLEGQKTAAFEIVDDLGDSPDYLFIPVGNAGNITAYWRGFTEARRLSWCPSVPKMMGVQSEGAAPIVRGEPVAEPHSVASAIRVGNPASWKGAVAARDESGGAIDMVSDDQIMEAYKRMAREEGIFCEPAAAASVAGLLKTIQGWPPIRWQTGGLRDHRHRFERPRCGARGRPGDPGRVPCRCIHVREGVGARRLVIASDLEVDRPGFANVDRSPWSRVRAGGIGDRA